MSKQMNKQINLFPKTNSYLQTEPPTLHHEKRDIDIIRATGTINSLHDIFFKQKEKIDLKNKKFIGIQGFLKFCLSIKYNILTMLLI